MLAALALPFLPRLLPSLPKIELPSWAWTALAVGLLILGYTVHVERGARERARAASQAQENRRIARELEARQEMERRYAKAWDDRPADRAVLVDRLREHAF